MASDAGRGLGATLGLLTFLGGVALLLFTFAAAWRLFQASPQEALGLAPGSPLDANEAGRTGITLLYRIGLLLVMSAVSSVVANRGIRLFLAAREHHHGPPKPEEAPSQPG